MRLRVDCVVKRIEGWTSRGRVDLVRGNGASKPLADHDEAEIVKVLDEAPFYATGMRFAGRGGLRQPLQCRLYLDTGLLLPGCATAVAL